MRRRRPQKGTEQDLVKSNELMMLIGMSEWRQQHPQAPLREIEEAMDERLAKFRAGMLEELAKMSPRADWGQTREEERPKCEQCGKPLQSRGKHRRTLHTSGGQEVEIERSYGTCPDCGQGLFPPR